MHLKNVNLTLSNGEYLNIGTHVFHCSSIMIIFLGVAVSGSVGTPAGSVKSEDPSSPASSFEDKRKANFDKGQAELERRRQSLIDQQRQEEDARKKKEKEEAEAREKQK